MKLHDLRPAPGSHTRRTRVGRGIAAGKGKTAGRGTKGQKARAGASIPPWFEGGQTPLHQRIPKLRGFENRFKVYYEVVNVGAIAAAAERGAFESGDLPGAPKGKKAAPLTVNQDVLRAVGLVRTMSKPLKILGAGDLDVALFVVADAFTKSAREKIEAAGGSVSVLETPAKPTKAIGVEDEPATEPTESKKSKAKAQAAETTAEAVETEPQAADEAPARPAGRSRKAAAPADDEAAPAEASAAVDASAEEAETETATDAAADSDSDDSEQSTAQAGDAQPAEAAEADATDDENA
jgi:large subunit ribosomal protein L15